MKKQIFIFFTSFFIFFSFLLFFIFHFEAQTAEGKKIEISKKVQDILKTLPEKQVTLKFVFQKSLESSSELKMLLSQKISAKAPYLRSKASLQMDYELFSDLSFLDDQTEGLTIFQPEKKKVPSYTLGISKGFSSGTKFSGQWNYQFLDIEQKKLQNFSRNQSNSNPSETNNFSLFQPPDQYYESNFSFTVSQSLLKGLFRGSKRKYLKANQMMKDVIEFGVDEKIEKLFLNLADLFYKIWLFQKKINALKEDSKRQRHLLKITKIKKERGTEVESNFLLIQAHLIQIEQQEKSVAQELKALWVHLVRNLNLPETLIHFDPLLVPMKIYKERQQAMNLCKTQVVHEDSIFKNNLEIQKIQKELVSKELISSYWKDQMLPDLFLNFRLGSNGYDERAFSPFKETFQFEHSAWSVGLNFKMNFFNFQQKAELSEVVSRKTFLNLKLRKKKQDLRTHWFNSCQKLKITLEQVRNYQKVYDLQKKRSQLEERRFQIGRTSAFNVVQAGKDVTHSESMLYKSIHDAEILSWKIYQMHGRLLDSILSN